MNSISDTIDVTGGTVGFKYRFDNTCKVSQEATWDVIRNDENHFNYTYGNGKVRVSCGESEGETTRQCILRAMIGSMQCGTITVSQGGSVVTCDCNSFGSIEITYTVPYTGATANTVIGHYQVNSSCDDKVSFSAQGLTVNARNGDIVLGSAIGSSVDGRSFNISVKYDSVRCTNYNLVLHQDGTPSDCNCNDISTFNINSSNVSEYCSNYAFITLYRPSGFPSKSCYLIDVSEIRIGNDVIPKLPTKDTSRTDRYYYVNYGSTASTVYIQNSNVCRTSSEQMVIKAHYVSNARLENGSIVGGTNCEDKTLQTIILTARNFFYSCDDFNASTVIYNTRPTDGKKWYKVDDTTAMLKYYDYNSSTLPIELFEIDIRNVNINCGYACNDFSITLDNGAGFVSTQVGVTLQDSDGNLSVMGRIFSNNINCEQREALFTLRYSANGINCSKQFKLTQECFDEQECYDCSKNLSHEYFDSTIEYYQQSIMLTLKYIPPTRDCSSFITNHLGKVNLVAEDVNGNPINWITTSTYDTDPQYVSPNGYPIWDNGYSLVDGLTYRCKFVANIAQNNGSVNRVGKIKVTFSDDGDNNCVIKNCIHYITINQNKNTSS